MYRVWFRVGGAAIDTSGSRAGERSVKLIFGVVLHSRRGPRDGCTSVGERASERRFRGLSFWQEPLPVLCLKSPVPWERVWRVQSQEPIPVPSHRVEAAPENFAPSLIPYATLSTLRSLTFN